MTWAGHIKEPDGRPACEAFSWALRPDVPQGRSGYCKRCRLALRRVRWLQAHVLEVKR